MFLAPQFNNFYGFLPDPWGNGENGVKPMLKSLTFDDSFFSGTLPVSLSKLTEIEEVLFSHNRISGSVPVEFGGLFKVKEIEREFYYITRIVFMLLFIQFYNHKLPPPVLISYLFFNISSDDAYALQLLQRIHQVFSLFQIPCFLSAKFFQNLI
ncbi:hypothetical protein L6452_09539 [Arctium lappa]|uniref:Uncharacterized protein n=1 Tax=Arctium lappa TaxID=4217 RepID=A0ACB9DKC9_ARCLA|nr:hypothetical protein L6452_09539 [Arctium lappa]